jgi:hypothetical protein
MNWRAIEAALIDSLRRCGCKLRCENGLTYVVEEFLDENSGELLSRHYALNVEQLARDLANNNPVIAESAAVLRSLTRKCSRAGKGVSHAPI